MSIFGTIFSDDALEDAVRETLKKWFSDYLDEIEDQRGIARGWHDRPKSWEIHDEFDRFPAEMIPQILVFCKGLDDKATKRGDGRYGAKFAVGVACIVSAADSESTRKMAYRYGAAVRAIILQKKKLDGTVAGIRGVSWIDGRNSEIKSEDTRTLWSSRQLFAFEIADVVTAGAGPRDINPTPHTPYPDPPVIPDTDHIQPTFTRERS